MHAWWNDYIGLPFASKGRGQTGVDCWGLIVMVYTDILGVSVPSYGEQYKQAKPSDELSAALERELIAGWRAVDTAQPLDLLIFTLCGKPCHCGLVTNPGEMLHIMSGCDAVVEPYNNKNWQRRLEGIYRYER